MDASIDVGKTLKGTRTREKAILGAIRSISRVGFDKTTFQTIADECGLSQPLVVHYFAKKENVLPIVFDYLVENVRKTTRREEPEAAAGIQLKHYVREKFRVFRAEPDFSRVYLTLSFLCSYNERFAESAEEIKRANIGQIEAILKRGVKQGEFQVTDPGWVARMVNAYLMGVFLDLMTGKAKRESEKLIQFVEETCLRLAGVG